MNTFCKILSSKTSRLVVHMSVYFSDQPKPQVDLILACIEDAFKKTGALLKLEDIDLYLTLDDYWLIMPEFGFGAITYSAKSMSLSIDSKKCKSTTIKKELGAILAHELNHAARMAKLPIENWDNVTFAEDMIQEGIAEVFQKQLYPSSSVHVNKEVMSSLKTWKVKAGKELHKKRFEYDRIGWFYGGDTMPRWVGYTLGYDYIVNYLGNHPKESAVSITTLKQESFFKAFPFN